MILFRFEDSCGVYYPFQKERNIPVECNSDESHTPGTVYKMILNCCWQRVRWEISEKCWPSKYPRKIHLCVPCHVLLITEMPPGHNPHQSPDYMGSLFRFMCVIHCGAYFEWKKAVDDVYLLMGSNWQTQACKVYEVDKIAIVGQNNRRPFWWIYFIFMKIMISQ